ncbi:MAG: plastocyanin/azurin family copper-binding protein, partial [Chloroflexota bacterium]
TPTPTPGVTTAAVLPRADVDVVNFAFSPRSVTVAAGGTVTWTQRDSTSHTATGPDWGSANLSQGQRFTVTFARPGKITYVCNIHSFMNGEINVVAVATPTPSSTP